VTLPRPRLTVRVGITGHRLNKLGPDKLADIRGALRRTLESIAADVERTAKRLAHLPYRPTGPELRIVSALAEGADRLAVEVRPAGWPLSVILPMPQASYERDFIEAGEASSGSLESFRALLARADTVTELPGFGAEADLDHPGRSRRYAALGAFLAQQIDILVAVWDGRAAAGPGGTATVITEALAQGVGIAWIHADRSDEIRLLTGFADLDITQPVSLPWDGDTVDALLVSLLGFNPAPEMGAGRAEHGNGVAEVRQTAPETPAYVSEPWPRTLRWTVAYPLLRKLSGAGRWTWPITYPAPDTLLGAWDPFFRIVEPEGASMSRARPGRLDDLRTVLLPRSTWADALASHHGHLYRSAYVTVFVLAGLSVPVGLIYLFLQSSPAILDIKAGFVLAELLIISTVVTLVRRGTRRHWHRNWIETRELSELLRLSRPLACIGALADIPNTARSGGGRDTFALWYARATIREIRPVPGLLDPDYLRRVLRATLETEIREQREYHDANARNLARIDHVLHHWGNRCFGATIAVLATYLALWLADTAVSASHAAAPGGGLSGAFHGFLHEFVKPLVTVLAAGLPAFGAALTGIRAQGDFAERAQKSAATHDQLLGIEAEIRAILDTAPPDALSLQKTGDVLLTAMRIMMDDVQSWRQAYVRKALTLPA